MFKELVIMASSLAAVVILFAGAVALNHGYPARLKGQYRLVIRCALAGAALPILGISVWTAFGYVIDRLGRDALLPIILFFAVSAGVMVMLTYPKLSRMLEPSHKQAGSGKESELAGPTEPPT